MKNNLHVMDILQNEKDKDIDRHGLQPLDAEGKKLAEHKRFTFDVITIPSDPLR